MIVPNPAFENGRADSERAYALYSWPRAAQRER